VARWRSHEKTFPFPTVQFLWTQNINEVPLRMYLLFLAGHAANDLQEASALKL